MDMPPDPSAWAARGDAKPPTPPAGVRAAAANYLADRERPRAMGVGGGSAKRGVTAPASPPPGVPCPPSAGADTASEEHSVSYAAATGASAGEGKPGPVRTWKKCWDYSYATTYYRHLTTNEARWANADDPAWMEATDRTTGHVFLENVATGEFRWKDPAVKKAGGSALDASGIIGGGMPLEQKKVVWEKLEDTGSGAFYYFSSASNSSQWTPPVWMDYLDANADAVYYFNTITQESRWDRPHDFVDVARVTPAPRRSSPPPPPPTAGESTPGTPSRAVGTAPGPKFPIHPRDPVPTGGSGATTSSVKRTKPPSPVGASPPPPSFLPSSHEENRPPPKGSPAERCSPGFAEKGGEDVASVSRPSRFAPLPPPAPKPGECSAAGSWSPKGSVRPPPGPPPRANMPSTLAGNVAVDNEGPCDGSNDGDDVDVDVTAGAAATG